MEVGELDIGDVADHKDGNTMDPEQLIEKTVEFGKELLLEVLLIYLLDCKWFHKSYSPCNNVFLANYTLFAVKLWNRRNQLNRPLPLLSHKRFQGVSLFNSFEDRINESFLLSNIGQFYRLQLHCQMYFTDFGAPYNPEKEKNSVLQVSLALFAELMMSAHSLNKFLVLTCRSRCYKICRP